MSTVIDPNSPDASVLNCSAEARSLFNDGWSVRRKVTAFAELGGSDADAWAKVTLPHDALIDTPRSADAPRGETNGFFHGGAFEYRRAFEAVEQLRGAAVSLEFDGVYRDAAVFVNGNLAGQWAYGYSRFMVRIDPYLRFGEENEIRVECRTHLDSRWYAGAGIYRDVHLVVKPQLRIKQDGVRIVPSSIEADSAIVEVIAEIENDGVQTSTTRFAATIRDAAGVSVGELSAPVTLLPRTEGTVRLRFALDAPRLWSVDDPHQYSADVRLSDDDGIRDAEIHRFGVRSLQLDPRWGLRINGEVVKLRGACVHLDNGPLGAVSTLSAELRKVRILKEAGFNAIRSSHGPIGTALLDACDELGMLVMDETFDMWTVGKSDFDYSYDFPRWWEQDVDALVAKDFNHPSVIFYSIGNEIPETGSAIGSTWGRRIAERLRRLDGTRLITNGINPFVSMLDVIVPQMQARRSATSAEPAGGVNGMMAGFNQMMGQIQASDSASDRTEESFAVLDVAGMNYADSRYELDRERFPSRISVGTETWPNSIATNWALVLADPRVIGDFTWTGWDYLGEVGIGAIRYTGDAGGGGSSFSGGYPELTAGCGDIDIIGTRLPMSYFRETVFGLRSEPYIAVGRPERHGQPIAVATPWSWTDSLGSWAWPGHEGAPVDIEVYSDGEEVELLLDGAVIERAAVGAAKPFRALFSTEYRSGELTAVAYVGGVESGRSTLRSAGVERELRLAIDGDLRHGADGLIFVEIAVTDAAGTVVPNEPATVHLKLDGPAVVVAMGTGSRASEERFSDAFVTTHDGRALAIVRPTASGDIRISVASDALPATNTVLRNR